MEEEDFTHVGFSPFFTVDKSRISEKSNIFYAKCKLCDESKKSLAVAKDSASNLKKHIKVKKMSMIQLIFMCLFLLSVVF